MSPNKGMRWHHQMVMMSLFSLAFMLSNSCGEKEHMKVYKVGILCGLDYIAILPDSFKAKMTELGYAEGENIIYDIHRTNFEPTKEAQILKHFVEKNLTNNEEIALLISYYYINKDFK